MQGIFKEFRWEGRLLFVNKKKQKNFIHLPASTPGNEHIGGAACVREDAQVTAITATRGESFFASFCSQKEVFLPF